MALRALDARTPPVADDWRDVIFTLMPAKPVRTRIVWRPSLAAGARVEGPAVIEEPNATTLIHPGDVATVSDAGHLIIDVALSLTRNATPIRSPLKWCATPSSPMRTRWRTHSPRPPTT